MIKNIKYIIAPLAFLTPLFASAQLTETTKLLQSAQYIIATILIPIAFTLALLYFFYGVAKYIRSEGTGKEEGRNIMIWGVVALFVMSSVWGLVAFLRGELIGGNNPTSSPIPTIGGSSGGSGYNVNGGAYIPGL